MQTPKDGKHQQTNTRSLYTDEHMHKVISRLLSKHNDTMGYPSTDTRIHIDPQTEPYTSLGTSPTHAVR